MTHLQVKKITKYLIQDILRDTYNDGLLDKDNHDISDLKMRLKIEIEARLSVIPEGQHTFESLVSAIKSQIKVKELLTEKLQF